MSFFKGKEAESLAAFVISCLRQWNRKVNYLSADAPFLVCEHI